MCQYLIERGADVAHEDTKKNTPYSIAKKNSKHAILKLLVTSGAKHLSDQSPEEITTKKKSKSCPKYLQLDKNKSAEKPIV